MQPQNDSCYEFWLRWLHPAEPFLVERGQRKSWWDNLCFIRRDRGTGHVVIKAGAGGYWVKLADGGEVPWTELDLIDAGELGSTDAPSDQEVKRQTEGQP